MAKGGVETRNQKIVVMILWRMLLFLGPLALKHWEEIVGIVKALRIYGSPLGDAGDEEPQEEKKKKRERRRRPKNSRTFPDALSNKPIPAGVLPLRSWEDDVWEPSPDEYYPPDDGWRQLEARFAGRRVDAYGQEDEVINDFARKLARTIEQVRTGRLS